MTTWVLILTLLSRYGEQSPMVSSVGGFQSEAACMVAAKAWTNQMRQSINENYNFVVPRALCVCRRNE